MCWGNGGTEFVGVANNDLTWSPLHKEEPIPYTAWIARNLKLDRPETYGRTKQDRSNPNKQTKTNEMIPNNIILY